MVHTVLTFDGRDLKRGRSRPPSRGRSTALPGDGFAALRLALIEAAPRGVFGKEQILARLGGLGFILCGGGGDGAVLVSRQA